MTPFQIQSAIERTFERLHEEARKRFHAYRPETLFPSLWLAPYGPGPAYIPLENNLQLNTSKIERIIRRDIPQAHGEAFVYFHELGHWFDQRIRGKSPLRDWVKKMRLLLDEAADERAYARLPSERIADTFALKHVNELFGTSYRSRFELLAL